MPWTGGYATVTNPVCLGNSSVTVLSIAGQALARLIAKVSTPTAVSSPTNTNHIRLGTQVLESRITPDASSVLVSGLFNTGIDGTGHAISAGSVDAHYALVSSPDQNNPGPAAHVVDQTGFPIANGIWAANSAASTWLAPLTDGNTSVEVGDYEYETTFDLWPLSGDGLNDFHLTGQWATDNGGVDIVLNGASIGTSTPNADFQFHHFDIGVGLREGSNTIRFIVHNDPLEGNPPQGNPTGVRVEFDQAAPVAGFGTELASGLYSTGTDDDRYASVGGAWTPIGPSPRALTPAKWDRLLM